MAIVLILFLALLLRLVNLNQSLWLDEAIQAITVRGSFLGLFNELRGDFHPPLYHLLMWVWVRIFGTSEISLRLPSVLFGVGTVFVVYLIGKEVQLASSHLRGNFSTSGESWLPLRSSLPLPRCFNLGGGISLMAALFVATAPFHIYYSQEARMYAMSTFFASLSMYFFMRVMRKENVLRLISHPLLNGIGSHCHAEFSSASLEIPKPVSPGVSQGGRVRNDTIWANSRLVIAYVFSTIFLLYTDYFGLFILFVQVIVSIIFLRKKMAALLPCYIAMLLLFIPWLPMFWQQIQVGRQAIQVLPEWGRLVNLGFLKALPLTFIKFSIGRITIFNKKLYAAISGILFAVYGLIIGKGFFYPREDPREVKPLRRFNLIRNLIRKNQILSWLLVPILCAWLLSLFIPNYQPFRLLLCLPAFYLLLAHGISRFSAKMTRLPARQAQIILTILIVGVNLVATGIYFFNPFFHREDWQELVRLIESHSRGKELVLLPSESSAAPYLYYSHGKVPIFGNKDAQVIREEDKDRFFEAFGRKEEVWYIYYLQPVFDPNSLVQKWLKDYGYVRIKEISFNQILLLHFQQ